VLALILAVAAALRFYGLNWDGGHWLHPDERMVYFVVARLGWPGGLAEALQPDSPLNPAFFAYGSLPLYLLRLVATTLAPLWPALRQAGNLHLVARPLAALFDLGTVVLTYRLVCVLGKLRCADTGLGRTGWEDGTRWHALLAAALVGVAVLHVQNAHFYTVDSMLTFFVILSLNVAARVSHRWTRGRALALGVAVGLSLATKVSAAPLLLLVPVALYFDRAERRKSLAFVAGHTLLIWGLTCLVFVAAQPYVLIDAQTFVDQALEQGRIARGVYEVPYILQYAGTLPFLYSIWQTMLWGLGLPLGLAAWAGLAAVVIRWLRRGAAADALLLTWILPQVVITGLLYTRYLRYQLPILPGLCVVAVWLVARFPQRRVRRLTYGVLVVSSLVFALAFASIYKAPHPWIEASAWIYREVPSGSVVAVEEWDASLPLPLELDGQSRRVAEYEARSLALYATPDDAGKWQSLATDLSTTDYLVVASRRLYGSIPRQPDRYPVATRYYALLFAGQLGFELETELTRGPAWLNPRIPPLPDAAPALFRPDESFVVYDHPRALIFRNVERLSADELLRRLGADA
jgi:4-amino-4-deoxy-L-arabinose transferase-like glycosyltransferase